MKVNTVSFYHYVEKILNPYKWGLSLVASVMMAGFFSFVVVKGQIDSDRQILSALSPYVATLAESSDRPEILRVLENAAKVSASKIVLVKDGHIFGTSGLVDELDIVFQKPIVDFQIFDVLISKGQIVSSIKAKRQNGFAGDSELYVFTMLAPIVQSTLGIFVATFIVCILLALVSSLQMKRAIRKALKPLNQLHHEIENLSVFEATFSEPIKVQELEMIRQTLHSAKIDLENAKDRLAEEKAQKMSAEAFKRLIHDLHNPVAALRTMVKLAFDPSMNSEDKAEIFENLPRIADQILGQVTSAKKNLEEEPIALREIDVLTTVYDSVRQVSVLSPEKRIVTELSCEELLVAHDPSLLKRALVNLLENAVVAAESLVRVSVQKDTTGTFIRVCDDGSGMDESLIPLYLQGRLQSGKANRQAFGLSSTNHIVRSHGGKLIYRKSNLGGSSFEIRLGVL